jgi:type I restriction enzyme, S subunit
MIPDGWKRKNLGEIADISSGSTPLRQKDEYWNKGTIPWVTTGEIDYQIIESTKEKITELACKECSLKIHEQGTILMAMYGQGITRGRIALLEINAATNQACCAISVNSSADTKFIYFQLEYLYQEIRKLGHGGNQQNLNGQIIKQIPIMFPPLLEQCKIAEILGAWDESIDLLEKLIDKTRSRKQGLMQHLLTGKKRFKEFEGIEWKTVTFEDVLLIEIGGTPSRANADCWDNEKSTLNYWLSIADLKGKYITKTKEHITELGVKKSNAKLFPAETVVMSFKLTIGKVAILRNPMYTNEAICSLIPKHANLINTEFLYQVIGIVDFEKEIDQAVKGKTLNKEKIKRLSLKLPPLPEQEKIASILSAADEEISTLEKQLTAYKQQKRGLMQQLLTGKIRVGMN